MPGDPVECRQQAQECLRLAQEAASDRAGKDYAALADTWEQLANIFECDNVLLKALSAAGLNVFQLETQADQAKSRIIRKVVRSELPLSEISVRLGPDPSSRGDAFGQSR